MMDMFTLEHKHECLIIKPSHTFVQAYLIHNCINAYAHEVKFGYILY